MLGAYNIDSDDDEEDEWEAPTNIPKSASTHIKELEKVRAVIIIPGWTLVLNLCVLWILCDLCEQPCLTKASTR